MSYTPLHKERGEPVTSKGWLVVWGTPPWQRPRTRRGVGYIVGIGFIITLHPFLIALPIALAMRVSTQPVGRRRQNRGSNCCDDLDEDLTTIDAVMNTMALNMLTIVTKNIRSGPLEVVWPARQRDMGRM